MNRKRAVVSILLTGLMGVLFVLGFTQVNANRSTDSPEVGLSSVGRSPTSRLTAPPSSNIINLQGGNVAYGFEHFSESLVWFDLNTPGILNSIAPTPAGELFIGADFLSGDFSKLYALTFYANEFVSVDTYSGAITLIGMPMSIGNQFWTGMANDPTTDVLYATSAGDAGTTQCTGLSTLYTIDATTGVATLVGPITNAPCIIGIAINAAGELYGLDIVDDTLVRINKTTGIGTIVGPIGYDANYSQGIDFDDVTGVLYVAAFNNATLQGELRIADTATGYTTLVGYLGNQGQAELGTIAIGALYQGPPMFVPIDPETGGTLVYTDPQGLPTVIQVPPNAVTETIDLAFIPHTEPGFPLPMGYLYGHHAFDLNANMYFVYLPLIGDSTAVNQPLLKPMTSAPAPDLPRLAPEDNGYTFLLPVTVTISYSDEDVIGIDEASLRLFYWDGRSNWLDTLYTCPEPLGYTNNPAENYIQVQVCHLSRMSMVGN